VLKMQNKFVFFSKTDNCFFAGATWSFHCSIIYTMRGVERPTGIKRYHLGWSPTGGIWLTWHFWMDQELSCQEVYLGRQQNASDQKNIIYHQFKWKVLMSAPKNGNQRRFLTQNYKS